MTTPPRCPTCHAPWRAALICPRCGSDLTAVMQVARRAWELREEARHALLGGDRAADAVGAAQTAQRLHGTPRGERLLALALIAAGRADAASALIERAVANADP